MAQYLNISDHEAASGPRVAILHRLGARKREDSIRMEPEPEYVRSMRMINLLVSGQHPGFAMSVAP